MSTISTIGTHQCWERFSIKLYPEMNLFETGSRPSTRLIGTDLKTVQIGFPLGMPLCRPLGDGLYEVRTSLPSKREARILFSHEAEGLLILHGFIKKTQKTLPSEIEIASRRRNEYRSQRRAAR